MPSVTPVTASLVYGRGDVLLTPRRESVTAAVLTWLGGTVNAGPKLDSALTDETVRLDRLLRGNPITATDGPTMQFQALWQRTVEEIERAFVRVNNVNTAQQSTLDAITAAMSLAATAKQQADATTTEINLTASKTSPIDGLLTASSSGVISIAAHSRVYADGITRSVNAGSVTGQTPGAFVRVHYNDAARLGGAVTYLATTAEITQTGNVHIVGGINIPLASEPPTTGVGTTPPGYVRESFIDVR